MQADVMRAFTRSVLENAGHYKWTTMGFGMIRTYLDHAKRWRRDRGHNAA